MSRAVVATAFGGPEVLSVVDVEHGRPGPGEVLLDVRAAGVNPIDWKVYSGGMGADPDRVPMRLGSEAAGVVREVGPAAIGPEGAVEVGDEVIVGGISGAYAEALVVPAANVVPKPANLNFEQAAGLLLTGGTAVHALAVLDVEAGDTILVHAASGGVGQMAVQLATMRGATVIGTAGEPSQDRLRELGAVPVLHGDGLLERVRAAAPDGIDGVIDCIGNDEAIDVSLQLVEDPGRIVSIAAFGRGGDGITLIGGGPGADPGTELRAQSRAELSRWAEQGRLQVLVAATYPLERAGDAHREIRRGHTHGKIALTT